MSDLFACLYCLPSAEGAPSADALVSVAREFSPRYQRDGDRRVSIDVRGLDRLFGTPQAIAAELTREARDRGLRVHVGVASTNTAAHVVTLARPGITVVPRGEEAATLAPFSIDLLHHFVAAVEGADRSGRKDTPGRSLVPVFTRWGVKTLGALAALPASELAARVGRQGGLWQAIALGRDIRPLVPDLPEERFEGSLDLEWPIEGIEPLSFVLTRLFEPLAARLERRDRAAAVLHVSLRLVPAASAPPETHVRRLALPSPIRDPRVLRTLVLLDIEAHPPSAAVNGVSVGIEPTPGRVLQHTLFTRAVPTPDVLSTLLARLAAVMGQDRVGSPRTVDSYRPGAFEMQPFGTEQDPGSRLQASGFRFQEGGRGRKSGTGTFLPAPPGSPALPAPLAPPALLEPECRPQPEACNPKPVVVSALRRCRTPVPAQVVMHAGRPVRLTTNRKGFMGGPVVQCAGPWRTSGSWWTETERAGRAGQAGGAGRVGGAGQAGERGNGPWNRDEWEVALSDGTLYRVFQDGGSGGWFIDAWMD